MSIALPILNGVDAAPAAGVAPPPAPDAAHAAPRLFDSHGRAVRDLRLSVTDRCNYRCVYCMDPDFRYMPKRMLLSLDEYLAVAGACVDLGIEKVRITGGEPTLYPDLRPLIRGLDALRRRGLRDIAMTTNGSRMDDDAAAAWRGAGLDRITLSLDSLRDDRLARITRGGAVLSAAISAINAAHRAGLAPVKVNAVMMRGVNDDEIADFARFAREMAIDMRLIEFMPLDSSRAWRREDVVSADEMIARISEGAEIVPCGEDRPDSTSINFAFADGSPGRIGIIAPVSRPFCGACSRLRITADGKVRPCLFSHAEWDLKPVLRGGDRPHGSGTGESGTTAIAWFITDAMWTKQAGHGIGAATFQQPRRTMSAIGG